MHQYTFSSVQSLVDNVAAFRKDGENIHSGPVILDEHHVRNMILLISLARFHSDTVLD